MAPELVVVATRGRRRHECKTPGNGFPGVGIARRCRLVGTGTNHPILPRFTTEGAVEPGAD
jgi:hypothetical protein